ncbi:MAG: YhbY family RNA-binding protein [Deltaproteobacteria bacterium]|nr:YhbY family RNA-binding protein [Deltaproteobacteria bacterium]
MSTKKETKETKKTKKTKETKETKESQAPAPELEGFQRKHLRGLAHSFNALVQVGKDGVTDGVIEATKQALLDHELIKVRMVQPEDKKAMAADIAKRSRAALCGLIGHNVVLYRPHPKKPTIVLAQRKAPARGDQDG